MPIGSSVVASGFLGQVAWCSRIDRPFLKLVPFLIYEASWGAAGHITASEHAAWKVRALITRRITAWAWRLMPSTASHHGEQRSTTRPQCALLSMARDIGVRLTVAHSVLFIINLFLFNYHWSRITCTLYNCDLALLIVIKNCQSWLIFIDRH